MASTKLALPVALLLCGFMVIGSIQTTEGNMCLILMYCEEAKYMTCPSTGCKHLKPACNCCLAGEKEKGCIIYLVNWNVTACPKE